VTSRLVSVIIVNWNGASYLQSCLSSLSQQDYTQIEICIVDNASGDNSRQVVDAFCAHHHAMSIRWIQNADNKGFCHGNNQGIRQASGEFILFLNADVTLHPEFIRLLVAVMQEDPSVGIALGKLVNAGDHRLLDSTGIVIAKNRRAADRGQGEVDHGQYASQEEVFGASGAACLCRRTMLEEIKYPRTICSSGEGDEYLDELFFAYKEDVDLSWRARLFGWTCVYSPAAIGQHARNWGAGKRRHIPEFVRHHSLKNRYLMLLKNERFDTLLPGIIHILWFECLSAAYILFREPHLVSVVGTLIRMWPEVMRKRKMTHNRRSHRAAVTETLLPWFSN